MLQSGCPEGLQLRVWPAVHTGARTAPRPRQRGVVHELVFISGVSPGSVSLSYVHTFQNVFSGICQATLMEDRVLEWVVNIIFTG